MASCTQREVVPFDVAGRALEYAFLVTLDRGGVAVRVSDPFGVVDGELKFGELPSFDLADGETRAVLLGMTAADLRRSISAFDPSQPNVVELSIARPPDAPEVKEPTKARIPVPAATEVWDVDTANGTVIEGFDRAVLGQLTLTVPLDTDGCSSNQAFTRWSATPEAIPLRVGGYVFVGRGRDVVELRVLSSTVALVLTREAIALVPRGGELDISAYEPNGPSSLLTIADLGSSNGSVYAMALEDDDDGDGVRRVVIAGQDGGEDAAVWDVELSPAGLTPVRKPAIERTGRLGRLWGVTIDGEGRDIATGEAGTILVREAGEEKFSVGRRISTEKSMRVVLDTKDPTEPHLIAVDDGRVFEGDAVRSSWRQAMVGGSVQSLHIFAGAVSPTGDERWVSSEDGLMFRSVRREPWEEIKLVLPEVYTPCSSGQGVLDRLPAGDLDSVAIDGEYLYVVSEICNAMLRVRRRDLCTSVITKGDEPVGTAIPDTTSAAVGHGVLLMGTDAAGIWGLDL